MNIVRFCIDNPVKVASAVLLLCLFGLLTVVPPSVLPSPIRVPVQLTPDVDLPIVSVQTFWEGASPQEVEREIVEPQEEQLKSLVGLAKMTSNSTERQASIELEFAVGTDIDVAKQDVSDALRRVKYQIPLNEFDNPVVITGRAMGEEAIAWMILRSARPDVNVTTLFDFVEREVKPILERVEGVSKISVFGGQEREIQVVVDPAKLARAGITFRELQDALARQNTNVSAGTSAQGKRDIFIRTMGQFESLADIEQTFIKTGPGGPIRVRDVATVFDGFKKQYEFVRSMGEAVLALPAYREIGSNVVEVMEGLRRAIDRVNREVLGHRGLELTLTQVYDETVYIHSAIKLVRDNIWYGGALAIIVLLLFLRSIRGTTVVGLSIPISIIGTFLVIPLAGRNVNVVMLAGLAFSTGMVVDNAVVVLENIYRHLEMGKDRRTAAYDGAHEVWGAVLANSLTTIIVFLPVVFVREEAGQLFRDIAIAVSGAIGLSMLVSIAVIPPLAARMLGRTSVGDYSTGGGRIARLVAATVRRINRKLSTRLAVVLGLTAASIVFSWMLSPRPSYLPSGNRNLIFGFLMTPPGYNTVEFRRIAERLENGDWASGQIGIREFWSVREGTPEYEQLCRRWSDMVERVVVPRKQAEQAHADRRRAREIRREIAEWRVPPPPIENYFFVVFNNNCFMGCTSANPRVVRPLVNVLNTSGFSVPDSFAFFFQTSIFGHLGAGNSVDLEIRGDDLRHVTQAAQAILTACMLRFGERPRPDPLNFDSGRFEARLIPDRVRAGDVGMSVSDVGFTVRACADGAIVGQYRERGQSFDLSLHVAGTQDAVGAGSETEQITNVPICTPTGQIVPLSSLCNIEQTLAPQQINHIETQRSVKLEIKPPQGLSLGDVIDIIENEIVAPMRGDGYELKTPDGSQRLTIAPDVIVGLAGNASKLRTTWDSLKWLLMLSGLICYLLMAGLFESFTYPFVIMLTVPLAVVGGFAGLAIVHAWTWFDATAPIQELDMLTILGFVILLGIVVNNGILIVHQSLNFARDGLPIDEAIVESVRTRIRPILMTVLTTLFGQLPLVLRPGAGAELYRGLGAVVLGGLACSTLFTLIVIPAMLSLFVGGRARFGRWLLSSAPTTEPRPIPASTEHMPPTPGRRIPERVV
ncbi:MAG: efflux RND transporter permease subunit [Phycisphaerae bacterium]|nr:efflux RND transporter permease subunit [Phycisphaerae bacterium]